MIYFHLTSILMMYVKIMQQVEVMPVYLLVLREKL